MGWLQRRAERKAAEREAKIARREKTAETLDLRLREAETLSSDAARLMVLGRVESDIARERSWSAAAISAAGTYAEGPGLLKAIGVIVGGAIVMAAISPPLSLFSFLLIPVGAVSYENTRRKARDRETSERTLYTATLDALHDRAGEQRRILEASLLPSIGDGTPELKKLYALPLAAAARVAGTAPAPEELTREIEDHISGKSLSERFKELEEKPPAAVVSQEEAERRLEALKLQRKGPGEPA
jgi:hypothetical protein